jgi:TolA-binding protein
MKKSFLTLVVVALAGLSVATHNSGSMVTAQDAEKPAATQKKSNGRLPPYYAQIGLSGAQRDKIYGVQGTYGEQIKELQKQIMSLEEKRDTEIQAVLTPEQKKTLDGLVAAAKKRAEERRPKK